MSTDQTTHAALRRSEKERADLDGMPPHVADAKAQALQAEARLLNAKAATAEAEAAVAIIERERVERRRERELAGDSYRRFYRFDAPVTDKTAAECIDVIAEWARMDLAAGVEDPHIKIQFNSPGGSVTDGLALFDEIQHWRRQGVRFTTSTIGMAASMAGILVQAGDNRIMAPESWMLIHKTSFGAQGDFDSVVDRVKHLERIQDRILDVFARRAKQAGENGTASRPITKDALEANWERRDWWISSDEALELGLVDEVR